MEETKVIYHIDDETTPYLIKIGLPSAIVTLKDLKTVLNKQNNNYKYFFKSMDVDFGVVKEEIADDLTILPCFNGRVVSWIVTSDSSTQSDNCSEIPSSCSQVDSRSNPMPPPKPQMPLPKSVLTYQTASVLDSSDLDSTSFFETESELTFNRDVTERSTIQRAQRKKSLRRKKRTQTLSRTSSFSSINESTPSLNVITVSINMDTVNFLGISIVGQSNGFGDGGIYVGSIMKGGAVALDGHIEPGDMILQVNNVNFENLSNDEAVKVLRDVVLRPGPIKLVVAKCCDIDDKSSFDVPPTEPVFPIDPGAWVAHTQAARSHATIREEVQDDAPVGLNVNMDLKDIVKAMVAPDSGLEICDRNWLKMTFVNAFIGADVVKWIWENVDGVPDRRTAKKYGSMMLTRGYIKQTVNKLTFSEQCYYVLGNGVCHNLPPVDHGDTDSVLTDLAPLHSLPVYMPYSGIYDPSHCYQPIQYGYGDRSDSSEVMTTRDFSVSQSDITSIVQQTNYMTITNGSNRSSGSSNRGQTEQDKSVMSFL